MGKMDNYGLDIDEVDAIIKKGMKWQEPNTGKWHARMAGYECVFIRENDTIFVITVYVEGEET